MRTLRKPGGATSTLEMGELGSAAEVTTCAAMARAISIGARRYGFASLRAMLLAKSIFADSGATVDLVGTSVVGGNLTTAAATNTSAAGLIDVTGNAISAIYDATVNNSGALGIEQGSQIDVSGTTFTGGSLSVAGILDLYRDWLHWK